MRIDVECYAGHKADERPTHFFLRGRSYEVNEVCDQWYGPTWFRVRAEDGNVYILRHGHATDEWTLESSANDAHGSALRP